MSLHDFPFSFAALWAFAAFVLYAIASRVCGKEPAPAWVDNWTAGEMFAIAVTVSAMLSFIELVRAVGSLAEGRFATADVAAAILLLVAGWFISRRRRHAASPLVSAS